MIIIDVEIPTFRKVYNFQIDENERFDAIVTRIRDIICVQENCSAGGGMPMLWNAEDSRRINLGNTPAEEGVATGSRLIFV